MAKSLLRAIAPSSNRSNTDRVFILCLAETRKRCEVVVLKSLLNFLPPKIVREIGDSSFASLQDRGEIKTWMVGFTKNSSLIDKKDNETTIEKSFYRGLEVWTDECLETSVWDWSVFDGNGYEEIASGQSKAEKTAIAEAKAWIDNWYLNG